MTIIKPKIRMPDMYDWQDGYKQGQLNKEKEVLKIIGDYFGTDNEIFKELKQKIKNGRTKTRN